MDAPPVSHSTTDREGGRFPRSVALVGVAIVALIVVALVIAIAAPVRPATYEPGTPEAAFQDYYSAWEARDLETAYGSLSTDIRAAVTLADYRRMDSEMAWQHDEDRRVVLLGVEVNGDEALLDVRAEQFSGGPLGGDRYTWDRTVRLVFEDGAWHLGEGLLGLEPVYYESKP